MLETGSLASEPHELDAQVWLSHSLADCKTIVRAISLRLARLQANKSPRLATIYVPELNPSRTIDELPVSEMLRETLRRSGITSTAQLAKMPIHDLLSLPTLGGRRAIELLAVLDHEKSSRVSVTNAAARVLGPPDVLRQLATLAKQLADGDIDARDVRFGDAIRLLGTKQPTLKAAIAWLTDGATAAGDRDPWPTLRSHVTRLAERLTQVRSHSLCQDLMDVLTVLTGPRKANIVGKRLGWVDGTERTLQEVGDSVNLTRERVRQMEARAQLKLVNRTVYAPALQAALALGRQKTPCSAADYARALIDAGLTECPWSPGAIVRAAVYLGIPHGLYLHEIGGQEFLAGGAATPEVFARVRRLSWETARAEGAVHLPRIAFALSEELEQRVSLAEIRSIVGALPETRWIDEGEGWYWLGDDGHTTIFNTTRKLLAVSPRLSIDDLYCGLLRSYRMDANVVAPKSVLLKMFAQVSWLRIRQMSHVEAHPRLRWQEVLTGVERTMVEVLWEAGGVLDHYDFQRRSIQRGVSRSTFNVIEGNSALFVRISGGVWALRGVGVDAEKLVEVSRKMEERQLKLALKASERALSRMIPGSNADGRYLRLYHVTASVFRNHVMTIARLRDIAAETRFVVTLDGACLGEVVITRDRRLRGLLPLLRDAGALPGQTFLARLNVVARQIDFERLEGADVAELDDNQEELSVDDQARPTTPPFLIEALPKQT